MRSDPMTPKKPKRAHSEIDNLKADNSDESNSSEPNSFSPGGSFTTPGRRKYAKTGLLGRGSFGAVHKYTTEDGHFTIAIKVYYEPRLGKFDLNESATREAKNGRIAMGDRYPNRFSMFSTGGSEGQRTYYVLMPCIEGETLFAYLKTKLNHLPVNEALSALEDIKKACLSPFEELHRRGRVFCDVNAGNIMIREENGKFIAELIDFGPAVPPGESPQDYSVTPRYADRTFCSEDGRILRAAKEQDDFTALDKLFDHMKAIILKNAPKEPVKLTTTVPFQREGTPTFKLGGG